MFNECYLSTRSNPGIMVPLNYFYDPGRNLYYFIGEEIIYQMSPKRLQELFILNHALGNNLDALKWMVEKLHYPLSVVNDNGEDPLMIAARYGYLNMAVWLLKQDVNLHQTNHEGKNACALAICHNHHEIADKIRKVQFITTLNFWKKIDKELVSNKVAVNLGLNFKKSQRRPLIIPSQLRPSPELIAEAEANQGELLYDEENDVYYRSRY